jgi:hypothetical protein
MLGGEGWDDRGVRGSASQGGTTEPTVGSRTGAVPENEPVSSPRHLKRRERISRTPLPCPLRAKGYATYRAGRAFRRGTTTTGSRCTTPASRRSTPYSTASSRLSLRLGVKPPPQVLQTDGRCYHGASAFRLVGGVAGQQGSFAPRALPRFPATTSPSSTLSSFAHFPGALVIGRTWLRRFRGGTRRASPVARRVLVTVLSLPPRRSDPPRQPACDGSYGLRPLRAGSASGLGAFGATTAFTSVTAR